MRRLKYIIVGVTIALSYSNVIAQTNEPAKNWYHLDSKTDKTNGISTAQAYKFLEGKDSETVIVAVIDSGIDIEHEDLVDVIWSNTDEIAGNGIDDDKNGYIDDMHGWNFIGGKDGKNIGPDTYEATREYKRLQPKYEGKKGPKRKAEFQYWKKIEESYLESFNEANIQFKFYDSLKTTISRSNKLIEAYINTDKITIEQIQQINSTDEIVTQSAAIMGNIITMIGANTPISDIITDLNEAVDHYGGQVKYGMNLEYDTRSIVGDNLEVLNEQGYGNSDVIGIGTDHLHGTHVAGIIGASRNNGIGINGVADNVRIMAIRAVPDGDERDKDVANAILYAVDNGAQIVNMSFGKAFSPDKAYVDEAVKYAESKGVLLIHAAGNSSQNTDVESNFPSKKYDNKTTAGNWLEIGASSWGTDTNFIGSFTNYGKETVDLFAPGVAIYSTVPDNQYKSLQGTSMASPVTAGAAAVLKSYYPQLSATDIKDIILKSAIKFDGLEITTPGDDSNKTSFENLSISGGILNLYEAVKLADSRMIGSK